MASGGLEETLSALTDLVRSGKARAVGTSMQPASQIVEAQWIAERRGLVRLRTEQANYSILDRSIEAEVLPVAARYGMGVLVWSPLAKGLLTGRARQGQETDLRRAARFSSLRDESRLAAVERLLPVAQAAGLSLTHLALAFAATHPAVSSVLLGPRTMEHLDDLLAAADTALDDDVLDAIDAVVRPGTTVGAPDESAYLSPALVRPELRRRATAPRTAVGAGAR